MTAIELFESLEPAVISRTHELEMSSAVPGGREAIHQALDKTVLMGGKRLRPLLTYLIANGLGLSLKEVDLFAQSIEKVHAASLAHDDVIDNATKRRGRDSINIVSSNKKAILAGDYLLANVIGELTEYGNLEIVSETSKVIKELSEGEWLQMELIDQRNYTMDDIINVAIFKTSSVMKWCCVVPAIVAELPKPIVEMWREFGKHLGIGFQLIDDTLDFTGNKEKEALIDLQNGIVNSVLYFWLEDNAEIKKRYESGEELLSLWNENGKDSALSKAKDLAFDHIYQCELLLDKIEVELSKEEALKNFSDHFVSKKKQIISVLEFLRKRQN